MKSSVQFWDKYNIIYISTDYQEKDVLDLLLTNGAEGIISKENSLYNVKNAMLPTLAPYNNEGFSSDTMRSFFFRDKSESCFLFYVPETSLNQVISTLNKEKIPFGIDASVEYPVLCPVICLFACIILMAVSKMKTSESLCLLPFISASIAVPFYSVAASISCFLFAYCIIDMYVRRKGTVKVLLTKTYLWIVLAAGIISAIASGLRAVLFIITGLCISALLLIIVNLIERISLEESHFKPVYILSARWIDEKKRYNLKTLLTMSFFSVCFFILTLVSGTIETGINTQGLLLPSPSEYTEERDFSAAGYAELSEMHDSMRNPNLSDFLNEKWYAETAAYRKVNSSYKTVSAGEKVILPSFVEKEGLISQNDETLFCFDDSYVSSAAESFKKMDGIEKLLVSEERFFTTGYASTGKIELPAFAIPATVICAVCFLLLTLLFRLKRHDK